MLSRQREKSQVKPRDRKRQGTFRKSANIYSLSMLRQMFYGYRFFNAPNSSFFDSGPRELFISISIFLPVIGIGLYPDFVFSLSVDKVETLISNFFFINKKFSWIKFKIKEQDYTITRIICLKKNCTIRKRKRSIFSSLKFNLN